MKIAGGRRCPSCANETPQKVIFCIHCGKDLDSDLYEIVLDGVKFGIALKGRIILQGMGFQEARETIKILNSVKQMKVG